MTVYSFLLSLFWCFMALPLLIRVATRWNLFDPPGPLKRHTRRISRIGGVAVASAYAVGILLSGMASGLRWILLALFILWLTGIVDDLRGLSPALRLVAQTVAASVLCLGYGFTLPWLGSSRFGWLITALFVVCLINAFNLLDGADGVAAGVAAVIAVGCLLYASHSPVSRTSASALLGSCVGFLMFNFPPAKIFLGDSGSTSLGLIIAFTGLELHQSASIASGGILVLPIFAGLPLLDLLLAIVRRVRMGRSPFLGDRRHFYDLLLQKGWSSRRVALATYAITTGFVLVGLLCARFNGLNAGGLVLLVTIPLLVAAVRMGALTTAA
jgi:UDP-GlcNAc:undecaprenyl-phosphate/decaprenyl-phosphate GlcNAc-1-phosphate transferase